MEIQLSCKRDSIHKGCTGEISRTDQTFAQIPWTVVNTSAKHREPHFYAVHNVSHATKEFFGVERGTIVYLHRAVMARKLKISYAQLTEIPKLRVRHLDLNGLDNRRSNVRIARKKKRS